MRNTTYSPWSRDVRCLTEGSKGLEKTINGESVVMRASQWCDGSFQCKRRQQTDGT